MITLVQAVAPGQIEQARALFREYAAGLGFDLCFQSFETELAGLPGDYAPPEGRLILALEGDLPLGCVALHRLENGVCEVKRLFVKPDQRGLGLGRKLTEAVIVEARGIGYRRMRLDTIGDRMQEAVALYRKLGFVEIPPYYPNPIAGALYFELRITN